MEREIIYIISLDTFGNCCLKKHIYSSGDDTLEEIEELKKIAVELAVAEPGSSVWSDFDDKGKLLLHSRKLWPKEEE